MLKLMVKAKDILLNISFMLRITGLYSSRMKLNADVQGSRVVSKHFRSQQNSTYKSLYKGVILRKFKLDFVKRL